jgi:general secretion pathway protein A
MSESGDAGYPEFYGFSENPFNGTPDLRFLFLSRNHQECLDSILSGIQERKGLISLLGEAGTGKTFLIHSLTKRLEKDFKTVFISSYPGISFTDLLRKTDQGCPPAEKESLAHNGKRGENWHPGHIVVFLDEAQNVNREFLERLQELPESDGNSLQIIFVGHPEFDAAIESESLRRIREKIRIRRRIGPLSRRESEEYIEHHLNLVGSSSSEVFTPQSLGLICRHGKGIPQSISTICENVLWIGYRRSQRRIDVPVVRDALDQMHASERILFYKEAFANFSSGLKARLGPEWKAYLRKLGSVPGFVKGRRWAFGGMVPDARPAWAWVCRAGRSSVDLAAKWRQSRVFPALAEGLGKFTRGADWRLVLMPFRQRIFSILFPRLRRFHRLAQGTVRERWAGFRERLGPVRAFFASWPSLAGRLGMKCRSGWQHLSHLRPAWGAAAQKARRALPVLEKSILSLRPRPGTARKISYAAAPAAAFLFFIALFLSREYPQNFFAKMELPSLLPEQVNSSKEISPPAPAVKNGPQPRVLKRPAPLPLKKRAPEGSTKKGKEAKKTSPPLAEKKISTPPAHPPILAADRKEPRRSMERLPVIRKAALISIEKTVPAGLAEKPGFVSDKTGPIPPAGLPAGKIKGNESKEPEPATLAQRIPVIHSAFAAREISPGETWKIYLEASAMNGDMKNIFSIIERGNSFPSITRIHEKNRKHFAGYLFLKTMNTAAPFANSNLTLRVWIQDAAGHFSEPVVFPLRFQSPSRPEEPPPGVFAEENLGPIMVQLVPFGVEGG